MANASRAAAVRAFETLEIEGGNLLLAQYWLSLWSGDHLPKRADFNPARVVSLLPGIGIFSVKPGIRASCRLAGTALTRAIGRELTGLDWTAYTPVAERRLRLERNSAIALGQAGIGVRHAVGANGQVEKSVELQLPFAEEAEDGTRQILFHLDWRAPPHRRQDTSATALPSLADSFQAIPLT